MKTHFLCSLLSSIALLTVVVSGQENVLHKAVLLYRDGDNRAAIKILERAVKESLATDAEAWNTLGLAHLGDQSPKKARNALEKAVQLRPDSSTYQANLSYAYLMTRQLEKFETASETALRLDPKNGFAQYVIAVRHYWGGNLDEAMARSDLALNASPTFTFGYLLKTDILMGIFGKRLREDFKIVAEIHLLRQAVEVLEKGLQNAANDAERSRLTAELESFKWFYEYYSRKKADYEPQPRAKSVEPGTKPLKILSQRPAQYTPAAKEANVEGTVRLAIHLGANGKVLHVLKLWGLGYGLDDEAIKAARAIKFEPKTVNGVPISVVVIREYTFDIY